LWIAPAAAVLVFRVGVPIRRNLVHRLEVADVVTEGPGVVSVLLRGRRLDRLPLQAGHFLVLRFLDGAGWTRGHPYSVSAAPHPALLRVTVQDVGDGSARTTRLRPGTRVLFEGPHGRLTAAARPDPWRPVVLLGSGVGITPLRALAEEFAGQTRVTLIQRSRTPGHVLFAGELTALSRRNGLRVVTLVGPRAGAHSWLPRGSATGDGASDAGELRRLVPDVADCDVYVCGPPGWADAAIAAARAAGVPGGRIHNERFAW
jgi:ferredoxin-NADP reductase